MAQAATAAASTTNATFARITSRLSKKKRGQADAVLKFDKMPSKKHLEGEVEASIKGHGCVLSPFNFFRTHQQIVTFINKFSGTVCQQFNSKAVYCIS